MCRKIEASHLLVGNVSRIGRDGHRWRQERFLNSWTKFLGSMILCLSSARYRRKANHAVAKSWNGIEICDFGGFSPITNLHKGQYSNKRYSE